METKWIEMPPKLTNNFATIQFFMELNQTIDTLSHKVLRLSFKNTQFIHPTTLAILSFFIDLAKSNVNQVILSAVSDPIKRMLESYELLENTKNIKVNNGIPIGTFKCSNEEAFVSYLDKTLTKMSSFNEINYIYSYLTSFFDSFLGTVTCSGYYNLSEDWLFFTMISAKIMDLDGIALQLLVDELLLTGGKLWLVQKHQSYDLKEVKSLKSCLQGTLLIIGFPILSRGTLQR